MRRQSRRANFTTQEKLEFARRLRANQTSAERLVWSRLRKDQLGVRFRRQSLILGWIADFYCPSMRLVIEIDGPTHVKAKDDFRDRKMREHGLKVLRFRNEEVYYGLDSVMERISRHVHL